MNITVFGMGYVGCVTAACLADRGHNVTGADLDEGKIALINAGKSPIIEPGLDDLIQAMVQAGRLHGTQQADGLGDISLVCVGTPSNDNGSLGLGQVKRITAQIGDLLRTHVGFHVVIIRSTVLPGTVEGLIIPLLEEVSGKRVGKDFGICMNPEFMRETTAIQDFHRPPFTVVGTRDDRSAARMNELYAGIDAPLQMTTIPVAETVKYVCNAFHALKVCFANEIGTFSKNLGVDSHQVMEIFCKDTKLNLSPYYLKPGFAFGGSCLPKDLRAIMHKSKQMDLTLPMLSSILESNRQQIDRAFDLIRKTNKRSIGVMGLSFKAGTDDLRESPIVTLIETLIGKGYKVAVFDEEVALSRLVGANRRYIEATIPHIASLMVSSLDELTQNSEVLLVSKNNEQIRTALTAIAGKRIIIDLVRAMPDLSNRPTSYEGICW